MSAGRLLLVLAATIAISSTYACAEAPTEGGAEIGIAASGEALKGCNKKDKAVVVSCENAKLWRCDTPDKCKSAILELRKGEQATVIKDCASDTGFFKVRLTGDGKEGFAKGACLKLQSGGGGVQSSRGRLRRALARRARKCLVLDPRRVPPQLHAERVLHPSHRRRETMVGLQAHDRHVLVMRPLADAQGSTRKAKSSK